MSFEAGQQPSYQFYLRTVGAWLDSQEPGRFRIIEGPDSFTVILEHGEEKPQIREVEWSRATLAEQSDKLSRTRTPLGGGFRGTWFLSPTGRQDFLRALGFELDDAGAHGLLVDEFNEGMLVTYSYLDPGQGYQWRKHMVVLGPSEIQEIVNTARGRRRHARRGFLAQLRGQPQ